MGGWRRQAVGQEAKERKMARTWPESDTLVDEALVLEAPLQASAPGPLRVLLPGSAAGFSGNVRRAGRSWSCQEHGGVMHL